MTDPFAEFKSGSRPAYIWISQFDKSGRDDLRLLKSGFRIDGDSIRPSVVYADWRTVAGVKLPFRRTLVIGVNEKTTLEIKTTECKILKSWPKKA